MSTAAERLHEWGEIMATASAIPGGVEHAVRTLLPGILDNKFLPEFPHPKQLAGHAACESRDDENPVFELLFGGSAGGGKSSWILQTVARRAALHGHYRAIILRRTHAEMMKSGAVLSRALRWWLPHKVHWDGTNKTFRFPSGATVEFGYHAHPADDAKYQGGEWHDALFDELTHWPDDGAFEWLRSRLRTNEGDPLGRRLLATSNPGQAGHQWVKERFVGGKEIGGRVIAPRSFYLPSRIDDNPSLDRKAYIATLADMHPTRRAQLLDGDWSAREPGDYFRVEWFGPLLELEQVPTTECVAIRWWDLAASESADAARTAGVRMVRLALGVRVVTHAVAFRATPGKRDARIVQQAHLDGRGTVVGIEIEPGSGGIAQFDALASRLRGEGFRVVGARPTAGRPALRDAEQNAMAMQSVSDKGKAARADPVASCLERGYQRRGECAETGGPWWGLDAGMPLHGQRDGLRVVGGEWTQGYLDELEGFPSAKFKDLVDATSGAWAWLQAHTAGAHEPPTRSRHTARVGHDVHPDDRTRETAGDRGPGGHWRP